MAETVERAREFAMRYPRLRARVEAAASGTDYGQVPEAVFTFGLTAILDGFERRLAGK